MRFSEALENPMIFLIALTISSLLSAKQQQDLRNFEFTKTSNYQSSQDI